MESLPLLLFLVSVVLREYSETAIDWEMQNLQKVRAWVRSLWRIGTAVLNPQLRINNLFEGPGFGSKQDWFVTMLTF